MRKEVTGGRWLPSGAWPVTQLTWQERGFCLGAVAERLEDRPTEWNSETSRAWEVVAGKESPTERRRGGNRKVS